MPLSSGDVFAGYTIVRRLGSGGTGEVYPAQHPRLPRQDALKVLPALTADREFPRRFSREADVAGGRRSQRAGSPGLGQRVPLAGNHS